MSEVMTPERLLKFWNRVRQSDDCWLWTGSMSYGYGVLGTGVGKRIRAHRLSWLIHYGEIPVDLNVLHRCDTKACVRPDHLYLGTHADNMHDAVERGQFPKGDRNGMRTKPVAVPRGERCGTSRLSPTQVWEIRNSCLPQRMLASLYKISQSQISRIVRREEWAHL